MADLGSRVLSASAVVAYVAVGAAAILGKSVKTASRQVLGSLNDFVWMLDSYRGIGTLLEVSLRLAETPCGPLQMNSPREETMRAFALPT